MIGDASVRGSCWSTAVWAYACWSCVSWACIVVVANAGCEAPRNTQDRGAQHRDDARGRRELLPDPVDLTSRFELAKGFRITQVAGNAQVPNAFSMTTHRSGAVIVSGPGYLRRLTITDGCVTKMDDLPHPPAGGGQGLCCDGDDLLFVGGPGVCRMRGVLADPIAADVDVEVLLEIENGREHQAHAIRKGHDRWWYLICGNDTKLESRFYSDVQSPVKRPHAGCLLRISEDFERCQVFANGFRNPYDFDFDDRGRVLVYDSDGERDVSLPWYRPTRVFEVAAGDHAGWINDSWKRPSAYGDMPRTVAALGRGSPTGVCYCADDVFAGRYAGKLLVADWTFGKITVVDPRASAEEPTILLASKGQFGFAVTDMEWAADGCLYATVGGRGTEGGLFRIEAVDDPEVPNHKSPKRLDRLNPIGQMQSEKTQIGKAQIGKTRSKSVNIENEEGRVSIEDASAAPNQTRQNVIDGSLERIIHLSQHGDADQEIRIAIRTAQWALGGAGGVEGMLAGYTAQVPLAVDGRTTRLLERAIAAVQTPFELDELLRLAAMLGVQSEQIAARIAAGVKQCGPVRAIHWLNCYAVVAQQSGSQQAGPRQAGPRQAGPSQADLIANRVLAIRPQLAAAGGKIDRNWQPRMGELVAALAREGAFVDALVGNPALGGNETLYVLQSLLEALPGGDQRAALEGTLLRWCQRNRAAVTAGHVRLLGRGSEADTFLRRLDKRSDLMAALVDRFSQQPLPEDRALFGRGLDGPALTTVKQSAIGLRRLVGVNGRLNFQETQQLFRRLQALGSGGPAESIRRQIRLLLNRSFGDLAGWPSSEFAGTDDQMRQSVETHFAERLELNDGDQINVDQWMADRTWPVGKVDAGRAVYRKLQCHRCHQGGTDEPISSRSTGQFVGPSLEGVAKRLSQHDLFQAILQPDRDIADRYRSVNVATTDGDFVTGVSVYQSADGLTLMTADGSTARINGASIESVQPSSKSLMPARLLDRLTDQQIADLWAFLKTL